MRINAYAEELTTETKVVTKTVTDDEFGERTFYGIRMYLKSPPELHHSDEDDDRTAITFWIRAARDATIIDSDTLQELFDGLGHRLKEALLLGGMDEMVERARQQ